VHSLLTLFLFDLRQAVRRPSTWIYALLYGGLGMLIMAVAGGAVGFAVMRESQIHANAPHQVVFFAMTIGLLATVTISAVLGQAAQRDYASGIHPLLFTTPLSKTAYLGGRFLAGYVVMAGILAAIPLGLLAGTWLPGIAATRLGPFRAEVYLQAWLLLLPNLLWIGAVFFAIAAYSRSMLSNYLGGVLLLVGYGLAASLAREPAYKGLAAVIDPFGGAALRNLTEYWTPAEQNILLPSVSGVLLLNRLLWGAVGLAVFALCAWRFSFTHAGRERRGRQSPVATTPAPLAGPTPVLRRSFGLPTGMRQALAVLSISCRTILGNIYFPVILLAGLIFLVLSANVVGRLYGTPTWPVTWQVLEVLRGVFQLFVLIVITFYASELVWQERDRRLHSLTDAMPVPTWALLLGKLGGLLVVVALLHAVVLVAGVSVQLSRGFHDLQPGLYLGILFGLDLIEVLPTVVLAIALQVLINHKQLGMVAFVAVSLGISYLPKLGLEHPLWHYGGLPGWSYSDMNGFGPFLRPWGWFAVWWTAVAAGLAIVASVLWVRGNDTTPRWRLRLARQRCGPDVRRGLIVVGLAAVSCGGWIFWNTNVREIYRSEETALRLTADYERRYKPFEHLPQPRITAVRVRCDLFPQEGRVRWSGSQRLVNRSGQPIPTVHVLLDESTEVARLSFTPAATLSQEDAEHGYRIYTLASPLADGDEIICDFDISYRRTGFSAFSSVTANGSFVASGGLPSFGYDPDRELTDAAQRSHQGLSERPRMAAPDDLQARRNTYIARDADWIDCAITVSTDADQTAIAPGTLEREWLEDGRRLRSFHVAGPMLDFFAVLSARYASRSDTWQGKPLTVLYHPAHAYNVDTMLRGMRETLDYASAAYGPYQQDHLSIAEFPRYGSYAQSFPGTIAFSEGVGFIARLDDTTRIDYPFYITAHEVAHQWWAHQVVGGKVQGATMLSEVLAQYTALMVMEHAFGPEHMRRFLRYELDQYLTGRSFERHAEQPLARVEPDQQYLHYHKGAVAMYALKDLMGEERLNAALRAFVTAKRFQPPPYANSLELIAAIKAAAPAELHAFIDDLFLRITLWDLKATTATAEALPDGTWKVTLNWSAEQLRADGTGKEEPVPLDLPIDLGVFAAGASSNEDDDVPLVLEKQRITSGKGSATFIVRQKPIRAGIDPYHKLIDRKTDDNVVKVNE
jgi:ABC-2 type transport system permease protein